MIYRVLASSRWLPDDESVADGRLAGAFSAGVGAGWDDLPFAHMPQVAGRCWFTEAGWRRYGRQVAAEARRSGRVVRVVRRKNPRRSQVAYRDRWQLVLLPDRPTPGGPRPKHAAR